ncbi:MAG: hypothetical protein IPL32_12645 [Chloracidobacterium sp.]|nr:hypothetical protein [Chloracidobacterium sp.]
MKIKFFALAVMTGLLLNIVGFAANDTGRSTVKYRQASRLVSLLPASDGVAVFDSKRFLVEAVPKLLSANQPMLNQFTTKLAEIENTSGIDLRKFDQIAVGLKMKATAEKGVDFEPVVIAGGDISSGALVAMAKIASKGKYREEKIGETSVYVFTMPEAAKKTPAQVKNSKIGQVIDQGVKSIATEVAVTSLDKNTLALGSLTRVRETLEAKSQVSTDISSLLSTKETAVMSFAFKTPTGFSKTFSLDNDELGSNIDSIQYMSGSLDVAAIGTSLQMMARTAKPEQALALKDMLDALQMIGKSLLGNAKQADKAIYGRMVKNAKLDARGNDVTLEVLVPQADIDVLVAKIN